MKEMLYELLQEMCELSPTSNGRVFEKNANDVLFVDLVKVLIYVLKIEL